MLNQHEVGAHNLKVALKASDRLISKLEETVEPVDKRDAATRSPLPMCKPDARAPRKIYRGGKMVRGKAANIRSAMPTPPTPNRNINSMVTSPRVVQNVIDMKLVAKYLAK